MKTATCKLRPPIKRHGGKAYLARRIVALMPEHRAYTEPFLGGGSVLLNKPPAEREVVGDLDGDLVNFWRMLVTDRPFRDRVEDTPYDRGSFEKALEHSEAPDDRVRAWCFLVRNRMSRGGLGKTFAWSDRPRGGRPGDVNAWETIKAELPAIAERVREVIFCHADALNLIRDYDAPDTLHYLDPPYLPETRTARQAYGEFEMTAADHVELLDAAEGCSGAVMISGYHSNLYDLRLEAWHRVEFDMPNHSGQGKTKQRRTECLWSNRPFAESNP